MTITLKSVFYDEGCQILTAPIMKELGRMFKSSNDVYVIILDYFFYLTKYKKRNDIYIYICIYISVTIILTPRHQL